MRKHRLLWVSLGLSALAVWNAHTFATATEGHKLVLSGVGAMLCALAAIAYFGAWIAERGRG
jgi:hypothetical protein